MTIYVQTRSSNTAYEVEAKVRFLGEDSSASENVFFTVEPGDVRVALGRETFFILDDGLEKTTESSFKHPYDDCTAEAISISAI